MVTHEIKNNLGGKIVKATEEASCFSPNVGREGSPPPGAKIDRQQFIEVRVALQEGQECLLDDPADRCLRVMAAECGENGQSLNDVAEGARSDDQYARDRHDEGCYWSSARTLEIRSLVA